jgi:hypothetical protein
LFVARRRIRVSSCASPLLAVASGLASAVAIPRRVADLDRGSIPDILLSALHHGTVIRGTCLP